MVDRFYLEMKTKKKGLSTAEVSKLLGLTEETYRKKLTGRSEFKTSEISTLMRTLDLDINEVQSIFLCPRCE